MKRMTIRNSDGSVSQPTDLNWKEALERLAAFEDMWESLNCTQIKVMLDDGAILPTRAHEDDAGLDIYAPTTMEDRTLFARGSLKVDTGVHIEIPKGFVGLLMSKSGLNVNDDITSEGVIDTGYTGSMTAKLYNNGDDDHCFHGGDKLTQLVIVPIITPKPVVVNRFKTTERGDNGFGSTGR